MMLNGHRLKILTNESAEPIAPLLFTGNRHLLYISALFKQELNVIPVGARLAPAEILMYSVERYAQRLDKQVVVEWFAQEGHCPRRQCPVPDFRLVVGCDEDNGQRIAATR